ncbi:Shikimate dehydrogenase (NADP(+)) [Rhynchospora pubera]|uniref:Shikimate dehydrogenase (NADP(+)) n=1 Tax=Rhynchospora pubera TaxID=906938 RepID=A0AAV8C3C7_9POAL|nr:Shikimate dehydrogenase (NADP(+)) [Rhynchospora pubera]
MTLVCAALVATTVEEMEKDMARAKSLGADLVEIRLDFLHHLQPDIDLPRLISNRHLPVLVTFRPNWEGGQYQGDDSTRFSVLRSAIELGAEYVDIELKAAEKFISTIVDTRPDNFKLIVSSHNYEFTPSCDELSELVVRIQSVGADIVKIATKAVDICDVTRMFQVMVHCHAPVIGLAMSERGLMSSVLSPKFGGYLTFGKLDAEKESTPGQPTIAELLDIYNIRKIGADTKVFGLIANPVKQSKSAILHNKSFKAVGFNGVYVPFLIDDVPKFLDTYLSPDFLGFSCSLPHKVTALHCCDIVDPIALSIGAVSTLIRRANDGKLVGYNMDYIGAISAIEDGIKGSSAKGDAISPLAGRLIVVAGAGGAAKAVAYGAKEKGARVVVANRTYERAVRLANSIGGQALRLSDLATFHPEEGMILANATALGMYPNVDGTPIPKEALRFYNLVFDAVYAPRATRLLREAQESGVSIVSGVEMFIRQAFSQFQHFTGINAPESFMRETVMKYT